jgi:MFS family permease
VILSLLFMKLPPYQPASGRRHPTSEMLEGFRYAASTKPIRGVLGILGIGSFTATPYVVLMPIFADRILGAGAKGLGWLTAASGIGAVAGALVLASRTNVKGLGRVIGYSSILFGACMAAFSFSRSFALSVVLLLPVGFFLMLQMSSSNTLIQSMVPDQLRGRVMAVYSMMFMGMAPLGSLVAGYLGDRIGAPMTVAICGIVSIVGGGAFSWYLPALRDEARRLILEREAISDEQ